MSISIIQLYNVIRPVISSTEDKVIYLTFDDGPSEVTPKLLDILKKYDVKATFFVIGKEGEQEQQTIKRILEEGHTLAPHTYCHNYSSIYCSVEKFKQDFEKIENYLVNLTGIQPNIYRFPGGSCNRNSNRAIMKEAAAWLGEKGYTFYDWNVVSGDDTATVFTGDHLFRNIVNRGKGKDKMVVLFHDAALCKTTPQAAELVIKEYLSRGYRFEKITAETKPIQFLNKTYNM